MTASDFTPERLAELRATRIDWDVMSEELSACWVTPDEATWTAMLDAIVELKEHVAEHVAHLESVVRAAYTNGFLDDLPEATLNEVLRWPK